MQGAKVIVGVQVKVRVQMVVEVLALSNEGRKH